MFTALLLKLIGIVCAIFASSVLVDWFFVGAPWTKRYFAAFPEVWRPMQSDNRHAEESRAVRSTLGTALLFAIAYSFVFLLLTPGIIFSTPLMRACAVAVGFWVSIVLPYAVRQHQFVKFHRMTTTLFLGAWLVKLVIASLFLSFFL